MASNGGGGGFGRFARRKTDAPTASQPSQTPNALTNESVQPPPSPNNEFASFDGSADTNVDTFGNVGMFGGSFDMNFDSSSGDDKTSFDFNASDFGFDFNEKPQEAANADSSVVPGSAAVAGTDSDPSSLSTAPTGNDSTTVPGAMEDTNAFGLQANVSQGRNPAPHTSPPRPKTAAPGTKSSSGSGLSLFSRKRPAASQDPTPSGERSSVNTRCNSTCNGQKQPEQPTKAPTTVREESENEPVAFSRVLPQPGIAPTKVLQTRQGNTIPSATPKGPSNTALFLPGLSENNEQQDDFATPLPKSVNTNSSIIHKTGNMNVNMSFVTPDSTAATTTGPSPSPSPSVETMDTDLVSKTFTASFLNESDCDKESSHATATATAAPDDDGDAGEGFDDLLSQFLGDLRSTTDLQSHSEAEVLNLEGDVSRAFARTLQDRSEAMDLLDDIEDVHFEADDLILSMEDF